MTSEKQAKKGYLLPNPLTGYELLDVCLKIPNAFEYRAAFRGALYELTKWYNWEKSGQYPNPEPSTAARYWLEILETYLQYGDNCAGGDGCVEYVPNSVFIEYAPNNPFEEGDQTPPGYVKEPWYSSPPIPIPGVLPTDAMVDTFSVNDLIFAVPQSGFPRFRVTFSGVGELELEFVKILQGGIALITLDGNPDGRIVDLASASVIDLASIGEVFDIILEGNAVNTEVVEIEVLTAGNHFVDVTFLPNIGGSVLLGMGGGLRRVSLCGLSIQGDDMPCCDDLIPILEQHNTLVEQQGVLLQNLISTLAQQMSTTNSRLQALVDAQCPCDDPAQTPGEIPPELADSYQCNQAVYTAQKLMASLAQAVSDGVTVNSSVSCASSLELFRAGFGFAPSAQYSYDAYIYLIDTILADNGDCNQWQTAKSAVISGLTNTGNINTLACYLFARFGAQGLTIGDVRAAIAQWQTDQLPAPEWLNLLQIASNAFTTTFLNTLLANGAYVETSFNCDDCNVGQNEVCAKTYDFLLSSYNWQIERETVSNVLYSKGEYITGVGFQATKRSTLSRVDISIDHVPENINNVTVDFYYTRFGVNQLIRDVTIYDAGGQSIVSSGGSVLQIGDNLWRQVFDFSSNNDFTDRMKILYQYSSSVGLPSELAIKAVSVNCT